MRTHSFSADAIERRSDVSLGVALGVFVEDYESRYGEKPDVVVVAVPRGRRGEFLRWLNYKQRYSRTLATIREKVTA